MMNHYQRMNKRAADIEAQVNAAVDAHLSKPKPKAPLTRKDNRGIEVLVRPYGEVTHQPHPTNIDPRATGKCINYNAGYDVLGNPLK